MLRRVAACLTPCVQSPGIASVVLVEDEPGLLRALQVNLSARGIDVRVATTGERALEMVAESVPDAVVLDLGLPGIDGYEVIDRLRRWTDTPILVISARDAEADKVSALDAGADDYLQKPFGIEELLARIRVALRHHRPSGPGRGTLRGHGVEIDLLRRVVARDGERVHMTPTEWSLVELLANADGALVTQVHLLDAIWGERGRGQSQYLRVYVAQLRKKLEPDVSNPQVLITEPGVGYRLTLSEHVAEPAAR